MIDSNMEDKLAYKALFKKAKKTQIADQEKATPNDAQNENQMASEVLPREASNSF